MARRRTSDPELSLFPFLSVLAAVMGTLILIIAGNSQLALANPKQRVDVEAVDVQKKSPIYVECRDDGVRIYPDDPTQGRGTFVERYDIGLSDSAWATLVRQLEYDDSRYLLLLVRPEGVGTFNEVRATVSGTNIDLGYEPLFGKGKVQFRPKRGQR